MQMTSNCNFQATVVTRGDFNWLKCPNNYLKFILPNIGTCAPKSCLNPHVLGYFTSFEECRGTLKDVEQLDVPRLSGINYCTPKFNPLS